LPEEKEGSPGREMSIFQEKGKGVVAKRKCIGRAPFEGNRHGRSKSQAPILEMGGRDCLFPAGGVLLMEGVSVGKVDKTMKVLICGGGRGKTTAHPKRK